MILSDNDNRVLNRLLRWFPLYYKFSIEGFSDYFTDEVMIEIYGGNAMSNRILLPDTLSRITSFLSKNDFIVTAPDSMPFYRMPKYAEHHVMLTEDGRLLKRAGSYIGFLREDKKKHKRQVWIDRKHWWDAYGGIVATTLTVLLALAAFLGYKTIHSDNNVPVNNQANSPSKDSSKDNREKHP